LLLHNNNKNAMRIVEEEVPLTTPWFSPCFFLVCLKVPWWLVWGLFLIKKKKKGAKKANPKTK